MNTKSIFTLSFFVLFTVIGYAAAPPPPPGGPACWPPPCIPIDGGISILMAAGAAYGAKKIYDSRKKQESAD